MTFQKGLIAFGVLLLFFLLYLNNSVNQEPQIQDQTVSKISLGLPVRLKIPVIGVDAEIEHVGVNDGGEMDVPSNTANTAWFKPGTRPGEVGSAVIAGHFNGKQGERGVFADLNKLKTGDKLYVQDNFGVMATFEVQETSNYNPGFAEDVFGKSDGIYLNLITCDGVWDVAEKSYTKRLVVLAVLI